MNLEDIISGWNGCVCSGSGGGDFTTAQVTIDTSVAPPALLVSLFMPVCCEDMSDLFMVDGPAMCVAMDVQIYGGRTTSFTIPLYKGKAYIKNDEYYLSVLSGSATEDPGENPEEDPPRGFYVTGDCTIGFN